MIEAPIRQDIVLYSILSPKTGVEEMRAIICK